MTDQISLAEEFAQGCDRLKAFARRMALERGGFVPDTDALGLVQSVRGSGRWVVPAKQLSRLHGMRE